MITKIRYYLVRFLLGSKLDSSGGFRLYDLKKVNYKDIIKAKDNGYSFFIESTIILENKDYKILEIPIILPKRVLGYSKMKFTDIFHGFFVLLNIISLVKLKRYSSPLSDKNEVLLQKF